MLENKLFNLKFVYDLFVGTCVTVQATIAVRLIDVTLIANNLEIYVISNDCLYSLLVTSVAFV